jgi:hypothetical protein
MPKPPHRPPRPPLRGLPRTRTWCLSAVLLVAGVAWSAGGLAATPFRAFVDDLLGRFHAVVRPCTGAIEGGVCFVVQPSQVSLLAEVLEAFVEEHEGAVTRGPWTSANGAHRVVLKLVDETWGSLELWLAERPDRVVEGWFERRPRPRD